MFSWLKKLLKKEPFKMDLQNFISDALVQVCNGIREAQIKTGSKIATEDEKYLRPFIVPMPCPSSIPSPQDNFYLIDFDLAVTINKQADESNKLNISVVGIDLGINQTKNGGSSTSINRIKFSIPIIYPSAPKPLEPLS